jgi:disulfide bond formation protein DsbB
MRRIRLLECLATAVAAAMVAGSLFMSLGMGLKACPLCIYERTFVMGAAAVLILGVTGVAGGAPGLPGLLALPLAIGGMGVAAFHVHLEATGILLCPQGILGLGNAPQQSLAGFIVLTGVLGACARASSAEAGGARRVLGLCAAVLLGAALAFGAIASAPPLPPPSPKYGPDGARIIAGCEPAGGAPAPGAPGGGR